LSRYRRSLTGPTYFYTVVAYRRRPIFCDTALRTALRDSNLSTQAALQRGGSPGIGEMSIE